MGWDEGLWLDRTAGGRVTIWGGAAAMKGFQTVEKNLSCWTPSYLIMYVVIAGAGVGETPSGALYQTRLPRFPGYLPADRGSSRRMAA